MSSSYAPLERVVEPRRCRVEQYGQGYGQAPQQSGPGPQSGSFQPGGYPPAGAAPQLADRPGTFRGRELAGWGSRVAGALIDALIVAIPLAVTMPIFFGVVAASGQDAGGGTQAVAWLIYLAGFALALGLSIYNSVILQGRTGQTWGKRVVKLRLVKEATGQPVGAGMAFLRQLAHVLDGFFYIGYLWPLWDAKRQTFADKVCQTVVLSER